MESNTLATFLAAVTSVFQSVIGMIATVGSTILGDPVLLCFTAVPLAGIGVGLYRRLINVA